MADNIYESITVWIALHKPKEDFPRELTPEQEEFWVQTEKEILEMEAKGIGVEISSFGVDLVIPETE